jgi:hypothetical protein
MTNKQLAKNKGGRPAGSGHGTQTVLIVRNAFEEALNILKRDKDVTLAELLADSLHSDLNATLGTISKFMPRNVDVNIGGGSFSDALAQAADIMRSDAARPVVIENDSQSNNITEIDNNITEREKSEN